MKVLLNDTHKKEEGNQRRFLFFFLVRNSVNVKVERDVTSRVDYVFPWLSAEQLTPRIGKLRNLKSLKVHQFEIPFIDGFLNYYECRGLVWSIYCISLKSLITCSFISLPP